MIEPYTAVGLIPNFWGIRRREDIEKIWIIWKACQGGFLAVEP